MGIGDAEFSTESIVTIPEVLMAAQNLFYNALKQNSQVLEELRLQSRADLVPKFRLGYAPPDDSIVSHLAAEFSQLVVESGLAYLGANGKLLPFFRDRITIPIFVSVGGEPMLVGFAARARGDRKPKYLNTKETALFRKREILFLSHYVLRAFRPQIEHLYIVEGYFDAMRLTTKGLAAVAVMSSSLSLVQAQKLLAMPVKKIILCFDGDEAGILATASTASVLISLGLEVHRLFAAILPDGLDPEEAIMNPSTAHLVRYPRPIYDALIQVLKTKTALLQRLAHELPRSVFFEILDSLRDFLDRRVLMHYRGLALKNEERRYRRIEMLARELEFDEPVFYMLAAIAKSFIQLDDPRIDELLPLLPSPAQRFIEALRNGTVDENTETATIYARLLMTPVSLFQVNSAFEKLAQRARRRKLAEIVELARRSRDDKEKLAELHSYFRELIRR